MTTITKPTEKTKPRLEFTADESFRCSAAHCDDEEQREGWRALARAHHARTELACEECDELGWAVFEVEREPGWEIQRCDACGVFEDDADAVAFAALGLFLLMAGWIDPSDEQREGYLDAARTLGDERYVSARNDRFHP